MMDSRSEIFDMQTPVTCPLVPFDEYDSDPKQQRLKFPQRAPRCAPDPPNYVDRRYEETLKEQACERQRAASKKRCACALTVIFVPVIVIIVILVALTTPPSEETTPPQPPELNCTESCGSFLNCPSPPSCVSETSSYTPSVSPTPSISISRSPLPAVSTCGCTHGDWTANSDDVNGLCYNASNPTQLHPWCEYSCGFKFRGEIYNIPKNIEIPGICNDTTDPPCSCETIVTMSFSEFYRGDLQIPTGVSLSLWNRCRVIYPSLDKGYAYFANQKGVDWHNGVLTIDKNEVGYCQIGNYVGIPCLPHTWTPNP